MNSFNHYAFGSVGEYLFGVVGGISAAAPGFKAIRMRFELDSDATPEQLDTLIKLTERYCVVFQTIKQTPQLSVSRS